jgi:predicted RNA methylase
MNPLVLAALTSASLQSMSDVAAAYARLLAETDSAWQELVKQSPDAAKLPDDNREAVRVVLYGPDSPATVPAGRISELEYFFDEGSREELAKLQAEIDRWNITAPGAPPLAVILTDRLVQQNPRILRRGNPSSPGEQVPRQFLKIISGDSRRPFQHGSGRLEMAQAIANKDNPLTARVMVNRIWLNHFGAGLVRTPSDFGVRSEPPSHPELLDYLARQFMAEGWSIKKLHRLMMLSATYQQQSAETSAGVEADPENRLLWRMNSSRLDFESMHDSLLFVTGELDIAMGGRPVELFKPPFARRRAVYGVIDRQFLPGVFRMFDFANPDLHSPQRYGTTVPQQALFFMNNPFVLDRARAMAGRGDVTELADPAQRVAHLYQLIYQRDPTPRQIDAGLAFVRAAESEPVPPPVKVAESIWQYGYGEFDDTAQKMKSFTPMPAFVDNAWQGGATWPDRTLGWVRLTAEGGHAGDDLKHAAIRRWIAPRDMTVAISGTIRHEFQEGNGIRARIVSSREGQLAMWALHNQKAEAAIDAVAVKKGDTLDFVVDCRTGLNHNHFVWSPVIKSVDKRAPKPAGDSVAAEWNAQRDFAGPPAPAVKPLAAWERYVQVLLESNEFMFVD